MNYSGKRIVCLDFESYFDPKIGYDLRSISAAEYIRDNRFWPLGLAYRFLDDEKTHWLDNNHVLEAWIYSVDWKNTVVVAHNVNFDGSILAWRYGVKPFAWVDTVALAKAVLGGNVSGYSLKRLAEYLGLPAKGEMSCEGILHPTPQQLEELGVYCRNDVDICKGIYEILMPSFPKSQLSVMDWTIRCFIEPKLSLDIGTLTKGVADEKKRREETIKKSGVDKATLSSNKQFAEYLSRRGMDVPTKVSGRTGKSIPAFARTDDGLAKLAATAPDLYAARIASKSNLLETRGESLLAVAKTGLFPFDIGFSGAVQTHRFSGGSGAGGNPQNFTRQSFLRRAVCAPEGCRLVVGDFSAIELRLLAWLAKEPRLINKLLAGEDVYADFASTKLGRTVTKEDKADRQYGKESILGLGYQMGARRFRARIKAVMGLDISDDEARATVSLYRATYFNVPKLWEKAHALLPLISTGKIGFLWFAPFIKVRKNGLVLPSGLEIRYPNLRQLGDEWVYDVYKKVYEAETTGLYGGKIIENICQALAGELCKEAIMRAEASGLQCVLQCHDEIGAVAEAKDVEQAAQILKRCMEQAPKWMPTLKLAAEIGTGRNWGDAKI